MVRMRVPVVLMLIASMVLTAYYVPSAEMSPARHGSTIPSVTVDDSTGTRVSQIPIQEDLPIWPMGSWWKYNIPLYLSGDFNGTQVNININQIVTYTADGITTYEINGTSYDTYHLTTSGDFTGTLMMDSYTVNLQGTVGGQRFVDRSDLSIVRDETILDGTMSMLGGLIASDFKLVLNNTYTTPLEYYDFPLNVGEEWRAQATIDTDGYFWFEGLDLSIIDPSYKINETKQNINDHRDIDTEVVCNDTYAALLGSDKVDVYEINQGGGSGYLNVWYSPQVRSYYKMHVEGTESSNFTFSGMDITLQDYSIGSQPLQVSFNLNPSTAGAGDTVYVTGKAPANADVYVYVPAAGTEANGTADGGGDFNITITAPFLADHTPTTYDIGSHGVLVKAVSGGSTGWAGRTLSVIAPDLSVYPEDIVLDPEVPVENSTITIYCTIHNNDVADIANVSASVLIDGDYLTNFSTGLIERNGTWEINTTWNTAGYSYGMHEITCRVSTDSIEEINTENNEATVRVFINRRPLAFAVADRTEILTGESVFVNASDSTDKDGWVTEYMFDFGDGSSTSWTSKPTATHTYEMPGEYAINVTVKDNRGTESLPYTLHIKVNNRPPVANITAGPGHKTGEFFTEYNVVSFDGSGSTDADGNVTAYNFSFGDGNSTGWQNSSAAEHTYTSAGVFNATLTVRDDMGATATATIAIHILNEPPAIHVVVNSNQLMTYEELVVNITVSDEDNITQIQVNWSDGGVDTLDSADSGVFTHIYTAAGNYTVTVKAYDEKYGVGLVTKTITITNRPPDVGNITITPDEIYRGTEVNISIDSVIDRDGQVVETYWILPDGGRVNGTFCLTSFDTIGEHTVTFRAVDDAGDSIEVPVKVNVVNRLPVVNLIADDPNPIAGQTVTLSANITDEDGKATNVTWKLGDGTVAYGSMVKHAWASPGTYNITVTVVDNDGGLVTKSMKITVSPQISGGGGGEEGSKSSASANYIYIILAIIVLALLALGFYSMRRSPEEESEEATGEAHESDESEGDVAEEEVEEAPETDTDSVEEEEESEYTFEEIEEEASEDKEASEIDEETAEPDKEAGEETAKEEVEAEEEEDEELEWVADEEE